MPAPQMTIFAGSAIAPSNLRDVRVLDDLAPFGDLGPDVGGELGRRDAGRLEAERQNLLLHLGQREARGNLALQEVDDLLRRARGREHALHGLRFLALDAKLVE